MSVDYTKFFNIVKLYAKPYLDELANKVAIDAIKTTALSRLTALDETTLLADAIKQYDVWKANEDKAGVALGSTELSKYLVGNGRLEIGSVNTSATNIVADLITFMDRDAQNVLENGIGFATTVNSFVGDGDATLAQTQQTKNDTIICNCVLEQNGQPAEFDVSSVAEGTIGTVIADGASFLVSTAAGFSSLTITAGTASNEWAIGDTISIATTSDDVSMLVITFRDHFNAALPASGTPTIPNTP